MDDSYTDVNATRALQGTEIARSRNYDSMVLWGAYSLLKVVVRGEVRKAVTGYITNLPAVSGRSPAEMETMLGLRIGQLSAGADIYRLLELPGKEDFLPRGYSTLVDGLHLGDGLKQDAAGYRLGQGAWQICLIKPVDVVKIASLDYNQKFEPGPHPRYATMYGR